MTASPAVVRLRLGADLRRLREAHSLRLEDVAVWLDVAPSTLSRIETGKAPARISYVRAMLDRYQVTDEDYRQKLLSLAGQGQRKSWWTGHADLLPPGAGHYLDLEIDADEIRAYATQTVAEFLQTTRYAAAACRASRPGLNGNDADTWAALQQRRQELLLAAGRPLRLVIDESALRRVIGSPSTTEGQLRHLADVAASASVTIQVAPLAAAGPSSARRSRCWNSTARPPPRPWPGPAASTPRSPSPPALKTSAQPPGRSPRSPERPCRPRSPSA